MAPIEVNITDTTTTTQSTTDKNIKAGTSAGIATAIIFVAVFVIVIVIRRKMHHSKRSEAGDAHSDSEDEGSIFENEGHPMKHYGRSISTFSSESLKQPLWKDVDAELKKVVSMYIIDFEKLTIGKIIGKGQFGMVYEAKLAHERSSNDYGPLTHTRVAVKSLKGTDFEKDTIEAFLKEGLIMKDFCHKNVLSLVGVSLADRGLPLIILPFMANGNLKKYIMRPTLMITVRELLQLALQVAEGMNYLASQKFVHRDLAARNCMIDDQLLVKVADFGLSRDIYQKEYYCSENKKAKLPVKWMAIESLTRAVYTSKTDVWSFGVLLWELLTRGALPYPDVANWEVRNYVIAGNRMPQPDICPDQIYELMKQCWDESPDGRPTFKQIITIMTEILKPRTHEVEDEDGTYEHSYCNLYMNVEAASEDGTDGSDITAGTTGT